ncbi:uncharacterized protein EV420DRAFT_1637033 [Desarmillaria tabescens]|uniref:Uncharacterized protein n=1 Tax=Armillaria tabescens TaxID=1929756 RepID=A0AA39NIZ3_ARMTA|nr:uncharacterized protein EV420DRAFT_1637033 [Desarmillaria tabescens]KAK0466457.1 hypothetical protein EV420DRAFT_1637033 [Desarmillaria tabescens]
MSIYSSSSSLQHTRSAGQIRSDYSPRYDRAQRPSYDTPTSTPRPAYTNSHSLLFSISPRDTQFLHGGSSNVNRGLYNHSRNSAKSDVSRSPYPMTKGTSVRDVPFFFILLFSACFQDSSSSFSYSEKLDTSPRSRMSDFRFPQSNVDSQLRHKHRPSPLSLESPWHNSTPALYNSGGQGSLPVQSVYAGTLDALHTGSSRRSHRPASVVRTHDSADDTPETPRTRANIMRNVAPIFARINSRAAAIGVMATQDGDLIYHHK